MKLKPNSFHESHQFNADMFQNQANLVTNNNNNTNIKSYSMLTNQTPSPRSSPKNKNTALLLMPFDSSSNQSKPMAYNNVNLNQFNKMQSNNHAIFESSEITNGAHQANATSTLNDNSDNTSDSDDYVHVTFDLNEHATSLLKKLVQENLHRLKEIGILSVQLKDEKPIRTKLNSNLKLNSTNTSLNTESKELSHNSTTVRTNEISQDHFINNNNGNSVFVGSSFPMPSPSFQTQKLANTNISITSTTALLNNSNNNNSNTAPPPRKRNRKTINELTNHLSTGNSFSNFPTLDAVLTPASVSLSTDSFARNLKSEEISNVPSENSITSKNSTHQPKRKRSSKSLNDNLDTSGSSSNALDKSESLNEKQPQEQNTSQSNKTDNNQIYNTP